jgi:hypothetical protein
VRQNRVVITGPEGGRMTLSEDEYWELAGKLGYSPPVHEQFIAESKKVRWIKMTGADVLEETVFPGQYVPLIPILGYELWVDGKRYVCGMVRRMMDGQRLHNYEASAQTEAMMMQPKAPFLIAERAIVGHEDEWKALNQGNPAYVTYNDVDTDNSAERINAPTRLAPPTFPAQFGLGTTRGSFEMEASVGMNRATLGQQSNAVSGRAKLADQRQGETANFHYLDNRNRSIEHMARIILSMMPVIYDERRQAKILGEDEQQSQIDIDPKMETAVKKQGGKIVAINPNVGAYDARVKVGPAFTTLREEAAARLTELSNGNPPLGAALAPLIVKMHDMPEAEKISRVAIALLPPNVQQVYNEDEEDDIPPAAKQQIAAMGKQIEQMGKAMDQAGQVIQDLQGKVDDKNTQVQDQVKLAMSEIKVAKSGLEAQAKAIDAATQDLANQQALLAKDRRIAQLELQFEAEKAVNRIEDAHEVAKVEQAPKEDGLKALAGVLEKGQKAMAEALKSNAAMVAELQSLTVEALGDMADAIAAPREVQIQRGKDGKATGGKSIAVLPQKEETE